MGQTTIIGATCCCTQCDCCDLGTYHPLMHVHISSMFGDSCCSDWNGIIELEPGSFGTQGEDCVWTSVGGPSGGPCSGHIDYELSCGPDVSGLFLQMGFYEGGESGGLMADFTTDLSGAGSGATFDCDTLPVGIHTGTALTPKCDYASAAISIHPSH